jgi:hypothetical protein
MDGSLSLKNRCTLLYRYRWWAGIFCCINPPFSDVYGSFKSTFINGGQQQQFACIYASYITNFLRLSYAFSRYKISEKNSAAEQTYRPDGLVIRALYSRPRLPLKYSLLARMKRGSTNEHSACASLVRMRGGTTNEHFACDVLSTSLVRMRGGTTNEHFACDTLSTHWSG